MTNSITLMKRERKRYELKKKIFYYKRIIDRNKTTRKIIPVKKVIRITSPV